VVYTVGRLIEDFRTIAGEATSDFWGAKAKQIAEEALTVFLSPRWPFNEGEGVVTTRAPYSEGTVAVVQDDDEVTLTGGTWDADWTTPAIIRIEGASGDAIVVSAFVDANTLTLDVPWPYDSDAAATYSIEFPSHTIPNYISITGVVEGRLSAMRYLTRRPFESMLGVRPWMPHTFWPAEYAIIPTDGTSTQKLYVWPPPSQVMTIRYRYVKAMPAFRCYRVGAASLTNGAAALTGTDTLWTKLGYSLIGQYFEFIDQPGHQLLISAVASDTAATVSTNFAGQTDSAAPYWISEAILCPDDLKPLLRAICRWKYLQDAAPALAPEAERRYRQLRDQAISRSDIGRDVSAMQPIDAREYDYGGPPSTPAILRAEFD
jgi:hypothetical protein